MYQYLKVYSFSRNQLYIVIVFIRYELLTGQLLHCIHVWLTSAYHMRHKIYCWILEYKKRYWGILSTQVAIRFIFWKVKHPCVCKVAIMKMDQRGQDTDRRQTGGSPPQLPKPKITVSVWRKAVVKRKLKKKTKNCSHVSDIQSTGHRWLIIQVVKNR